MKFENPYALPAVALAMVYMILAILISIPPMERDIQNTLVNAEWKIFKK